MAEHCSDCDVEMVCIHDYHTDISGGETWECPECGEREIVLLDGGTARSGHGVETFESPESEQITTFKTDELTALCPFDFGGPDHYDCTIRYKADELCVESKSLKLWLQSFRDREITAETLADEIYQTINDSIQPNALYIQLQQARRGGIEETVEVGDVDLR